MGLVLDHAKQGIERMGGETTGLKPESADGIVSLLEQQAKIFGTETQIDIHTDGGRQKSRAAFVFAADGEAFRFLWTIAPFQPSVFVRAPGRQQAEGMLSPNYNVNGVERRNSLRVQPINGGFTLSEGLWLPDADGMIMNGGATLLEGKGMGGHQGHGADLEHKLTAAGAASLGDISIASGHKQHEVRRTSSVARGLTDGRVGKVFEANKKTGFQGFDEVFEFDGTNRGEIIIPRDFIHNPTESFGALLSHQGLSPADYLMGSAIQTLADSRTNLDGYTRAMEGSACTNL